MNTFIKERRNFFGRLRTSPLFLLEHMAFLLGAAAKKANNRVRGKFSSKHRGAKRIPAWISKEIRQSSNHKYDYVFPVYPAIKKTSTGGSSVTVKICNSESDPEAHFENNRWRFLFESLIESVDGPEKNLIKVFDWIRTHEDKNDIAWETYSACERISNLLIYLAVNTGWHESAPSNKKIIDFISDSVEWICDHLEYYGLAGTNNHIINNARALVLGGVVVGSTKAYQAGIETFRKFLPILVGSSGFLRERSSHYQLVAANWVLDAWRFVDGCYGGDHADTKYLKNYGQLMVDAAAMLCDVNGDLLALIGDISPDASPTASSLRLACLYPEFWPPEEKTKFRSIETKGGWFRISSSNQYVLGNFPDENFPLNFPTHGHNDITSFAWIQDGSEILVDTGRYRYTTDEISLVQKSALGHNLPLVNGFPPLCESILINGLLWPRPYACAKLESSVSNDGVSLSHNGFLRATCVTRHERRLSLEEDSLNVSDVFEGEGQIDVQFLWNFGKKFITLDSNKMSVKGVESEVEIFLNGFSDSPLIDSISGNPVGGWISTKYGEVEPSLNVRIGGRVTLPVVISTWFKHKKCAA